jgi:hypothetical protein
MKFFNKLPIISYNGQVARNLLSKTRLTDATRKNYSIFHPYTLNEYDRIDHIAYHYYDNVDYMWLIYLANDIVDPYFDIYLPDDDFEKYITDKYGSIAEAQQTIVYWRNAWDLDDSELEVSTYDALPAYAKKYYDPKIDSNNNTYTYVRKQVDWRVETNSINTTTLSNSNGTFTVGERVTQTYNSNSAISCNAVCTFANATHATFQHTIGSDVLASNSSVVLTVTGLTSNATANVETVNITRAIPLTEVVYWTSISAYEDEIERNAQKKTIDMIDVRVKGEVESQLKKLMNG